MIIEDLKHDEGFRGNPYTDTEGNLTIGYGTKLPLSRKEAEVLLKMRLDETIEDVNSRLSHLNIRKEAWDILYNMAYQLGVGGLLKFKKMLKALEKQDYKTAAKEGLDSLWARQTPNRARRLMAKMERLDA